MQYNIVQIMDPRQSAAFATYLQASGWKVCTLRNGTHCFLRQVPVIGTVMRIPRPKTPIPFKEIDLLAKTQHVSLIKIDPDTGIDNTFLKNQLQTHHYHKDYWSVEPTRTLLIDIRKSDQEILEQMSHGWKQDIHTAIKQGVRIFQSSNIQTFISLWQENAKRKKYSIPDEKQLMVLLQSVLKSGKAMLIAASVYGEIVANTLIIFTKDSARLWYLAYSGKYPETGVLKLLLYNGMLRSKRRGMKLFDFEGLPDLRYPGSVHMHSERFKKGFGGKEKYFIGSFVKYTSIIRGIPYIILSRIGTKIIYPLYYAYVHTH